VIGIEVMIEVRAEEIGKLAEEQRKDQKEKAQRADAKKYGEGG
jgi:hypothetical protein